jgi:hypothetical protein
MTVAPEFLEFQGFRPFLSEYKDHAASWRQLGRFLDDVYNTKRIHPSLGYLTPSAHDQQFINMKVYQ